MEYDIGYMEQQLFEKDEKIEVLEKENAELKQANEGKVVEHFEAYGQCRDSRRIAELEAHLTKAKELLKDITSSYGSTEVSEAQLYLKIKKAEIFLKDSEVEK